ncbi:hypothetical protein AA14362_1577 [Acetobacter cerevisiae DSM 14362]|nr:hypothetical protein AA14362_1577 [Acetobacter cerevisiae DSM 14362]
MRGGMSRGGVLARQFIQCLRIGDNLRMRERGRQQEEGAQSCQTARSEMRVVHCGQD